jgi:hypothetical protein
MKRIRPMALLSIMLVVLLGIQGILPLATVSAQEGPRQNRIVQKEDDVTNVLLQRIPRLDPDRQLEIESFAQIVADNLVYQEDGTVSVNAKKAANLTRKQRQQLNNAVKDINSGHIGLAITGEDGLIKVYGNTQVLNELSPNNQTDTVGKYGTSKSQSGEVNSLISTWWDGYGLAIYLDPVFTKRLKSFDSAAIGTLVGLLVTFVCGTGIGCIAASVIVAWFWDQVWQWLNGRYFADSLIIHAPRWGWVYLQPFKSGAWFNGQWFRTWLWT